MKAVNTIEAAKLLGCSADTVRRHIDAGRLRAYHVGAGTKRRRLAVTVEEIERFQRAQMVEAGAVRVHPIPAQRRQKRRWI